MIFYLLYVLAILGVFVVALASAWVVSLCAFGISLYLQRNDIADVFWGIGITFCAGVFFFLISYPTLVLKLVTVLIIIWGVRLSLHIGSRFFSKQHEDSRYAAWRAQWTWVRTRSFFQIYLFQGFLMALVLSPVVMYVFNPGIVETWQIVLGLWLWCVGMYFETVGDWQLGQFIKDPSVYGLQRGDLMTKGLWARTRHPNYFGEMCIWWGIFIITMHTTSLWYVIPAAAGPITISVLLYWVSGVKKTEGTWEEKYKDAFEKYKKTTPILFPKFW